MITGRVVNSAGEPLSGAVVYASSLGNTTRAQRGTVDIGGEFDEPEAGLYRVSAALPAMFRVATKSHRRAKLLSHRRFGNHKIVKGGV
jgi:hypothetical protein